MDIAHRIGSAAGETIAVQNELLRSIGGHREYKLMPEKFHVA